MSAPTDHRRTAIRGHGHPDYGVAAVIVDPQAGEGRVADEVSAVERALEDTGLGFTMAVAEGAGAATRLATEALDGGGRFVVAVGDDGTVQDVVNGMFRDGRPIVQEPVLGVIAANSGCDLVRSFGLPGDVGGAAGHLTGENTYPLDVMKVLFGAGGSPPVRYAVNVAEIGFHAAAANSAARLPTGLRGARTFLGFWAAYARTRGQTIRLATDTRELEIDSWSVVVGNGQFSDNGVRLSPRSYPGDGALDALVFTGPKSDAYRMLPRMFRNGEHVPSPHIKEVRVKIRLGVDADRPMPVVADGRALGTTPVTFQIVPRQILLKI
jgi:diacylglycerol kinase (ATP)